MMITLLLLTLIQPTTTIVKAEVNLVQRIWEYINTNLQIIDYNQKSIIDEVNTSHVGVLI